MKRKILVMAGTKTEIIKLAPVYLAFQNSQAFEPIFVSSGQHSELLEDALFPFKIELNHNFQIMSEANSLDQVMSLTFAKSSQLFAQEKPTAVIVRETPQLPHICCNLVGTTTKCQSLTSRSRFTNWQFTISSP